MTLTKYIIDTSSLIELHRNTPRDVYPSVWKKLESLIKKKRLIAPKEVYYEIKIKDDQLAAWTKDHLDLFQEISEEQIKHLTKVQKRYPSLTKDDKKYSADPWVIALALQHVKNPQQTLSSEEIMVVTEEQRHGNRIRIPFVCSKYDIKTTDILGMFRMENWRF